MTTKVNSGGIASKHNEASAIVAQMSLAEKAAFTSGKSFWYLEACDRLNVPSVMLTDGPHGLRKQQTGGDHVGLTNSVPATCFPTASALAASWDTELLNEVGIALGKQSAAEQVTVLLGPGMNIKRHPLCGRNFEYFSEDPLLTGELAAAMIQGIQSQGVGASVKHFAANNQEYGRMYVDVVVDERSLREIYLRGFEIAVKRSQPWTVMCAYNRLNGTYCSDHDWLLNQVLRKEWGFQGLVVTDWGAANDRVKGVASGLDLEMPTSGGLNDKRVASAVESGELEEAILDQAIVRNVSLALCGGELSERDVTVDQEAHHALAHRAAVESTVLLKNDNQLLPLQPKGRIGVIGAFAKKPRYQGAGSSQVNPSKLECAYDAIAAAVGDAGEVLYAAGYDPISSVEDNHLIQEAVELAGQVDVVVVFAGLPGIYESEGFDRSHMRMPVQHNRLIEAACTANPNLVVMLANGSPVEMPWIDQIGSVVECYLAGQAGGSAAADILFGLANPSGKLAETFPLAQTDVAADRWFPGEARQVQYREGLFVGYRYFDSAAKPVLFPFGHGLSYTTFDYSNLRTNQEEGTIKVAVDMTNTGELAGAEVVQLYVHRTDGRVYRPENELRAFEKVHLEPKATTTVELNLSDDAFSAFDVSSQSWVVEEGEYEIRIGASSRDIRLTSNVTLASSDTLSSALTISGPHPKDGLQIASDQTFENMLGRAIPKPESIRPFHINSTIQEIEATWLGRKVRMKVEAQLKKSFGLGKNPDPGMLKMIDEMIATMPLRSFALLGGGKITFAQVNALVALLNRQPLNFIRHLLGKNSTW